MDIFLNKGKVKFFDVYYIKDINNFLTINFNEVLTKEAFDNLIEHPILSIIVPFCNSGKTIKKTIRSIQNQTFKSLEIILVNDISSDNSIEIINQLKEKDKRIKIVNNKEKSGLFLSRINGMAISKGDYIYNIDSDDMISHPNALKQLYYLMEKYKVDTIEFNGIQGQIKNYNKVIEMPNSKNDYAKIIYGKDIINNLIKLAKRFNLDYNYLILNMKSLLHLNFSLEKFECVQLYDLLLEIFIEIGTLTDNARLYYSKIVQKYYNRCDKYNIL